MNIRIRGAVLEDYARILPLKEEIVALHHNGRPDRIKNDTAFFTEALFAQQLSAPAHTFLVAETADNRLVGYALGWVISCKDHPVYYDYDCFYIDDICVAGAYRKNGIGRMLFSACKETAKGAGCDAIELNVWTFNQNAVAFYRGCGMTERNCRMEYRLTD